MHTHLYVYSKCSTCQKAMHFLQIRNIPFEKYEVTLNPPSQVELEKMLAFFQGDIKKLFNTSGMLYKELQLKDRLPLLSKQEAFGLLKSHGMLVKRPFLLTETFGLLGFNENQWEIVFRPSLADLKTL